MSWEQRPGEGAYGANAANGATGAHPLNGVHQQNGGAQGAPNVYHPYPDATPEYDQYADPAAAHGWQSAYDQTAELPPVTDDGRGDADHEDEGHLTAPGGYDAAAPQDDDGSVFVDGSGRRARLMRRVAIAVGAVCVLFIAVVVSGLFGSGPSDGPLPWVQGKEHKQKAGQAEQSASPTAAPGATPGSAGGSATGTAGPRPSESAAAPAATGAASASPRVSGSASAGSGDTSTEPSTAPSTTATPTTTTAPGRGNSGVTPGRGQGSTRGPK
ncbi:hypothetical protein [Streptomyces sp. NPDC046805]|uniref:hypothetical protein n=1 Tax=Streptomyces sp. NPDC046805 TaxID=3155134 RepID=UPI0033E7D3EE